MQRIKRTALEAAVVFGLAGVVVGGAYEIAAHPALAQLAGIVLVAACMLMLVLYIDLIANSSDDDG